MFNGVPHEQQFHQFITSRTSSLPTIPLPLTLPLPLPPTFSIHDLQQSSSSHHQLFQSHLLHPSLQRHQHHHHHQQQQQQPLSSSHEVDEQEEGEDEEEEDEDEEEEQERVIGGELDLDGVRSVSEVMDPWLKEEVLALLTIRSSLGNDFSDFIWSHVSRKLAELGYKRSAEKCKEKFEEVNKYCNNTNYGNYYRTFNELEALFQDGQNQKSMDIDNKIEKTDEEEKNMVDVNLEENSGNETLENPNIENQEELKKPNKKKRKTNEQVDMLKEFSEFVTGMLAKQEELHKKLIEDMEKREDERVAKEEAWRAKENERLKKELEIREKEHKKTMERQLMIIDLLQKLQQKLPFPTNKDDPNPPNVTNPSPTSSPPIVLPQNPKPLYLATPSTNPNVPTTPCSIAFTPQTTLPSKTQENPQAQENPQSPVQAVSNPNPPTTQHNTNMTSPRTQLVLLPNPTTFVLSDKEGQGKRWPREEVNALINLRCNLQNGGEEAKAPLWERISQGMLEMGYRRSAKKCKEKWENINKYFRKTKDSNKKRSLDSKTCPYFHQLNNLYNQGRLISSFEASENQQNSPKNNSGVPETSLAPETNIAAPAATLTHHSSSSPQGGHSEAMEHVDEGEKNMEQVTPIVFEY